MAADSDLDHLNRELAAARNTIAVLMDRVEALSVDQVSGPTSPHAKELIFKQNQDLNKLNKGLMQAAADHQKTDRILLEMQRIADIGGWELNLETGCIETTGQIPRMLGLNTDAGLSVESLCARFIPSDSTALQKHMKNACVNREAFNLEIKTMPVSGNSRMLRVAGQPLVEGNTVVRLYGVIWDVTHQKATELQLMQSEKFARATLDAQAACIAGLNSAGQILLVNKSWRNFNESKGFFPQCGVGDNYLDACDNCIGDAARGERSFARQLRELMTSDPKELVLEYQAGAEYQNRWFRLIANRQPDGGEIRLVVVHRDVTKQKRMQELERERHSLQDAVTSLEQVLGVVGHELRTPLAGLRAMTDFLMDPASQGTPEWTQFLKALGAEVVRMSDTVDNLLEAARLNSGRARWNWSRFNLPRVCQDAVESVRILARTHKIAIDCRFDPAADEMCGDPGGIRRLLLNLANNAAKHTNSGSILVSTSVRNFQNQRWIDLRVSDTGCGMAPEILARAGDPFALNSGIVGENHISGTGLGLAICKGIAAAHGGYLKIESTVGAGTTVTVSIRAELPGPVASESEKSLLGGTSKIRAEALAASAEMGDSI